MAAEVFQSPAELGVEGLVPAEINVLQPARAMFHALPPDDAMAIGLVDGFVAREENLSLEDLFFQATEKNLEGRSTP